jgi:hypothetical protein
MAVADHRLLVSKLSVTVSRDRPHDEFVHRGPLTVPPVVSIFLPCHPVHSRRCLPFQVAVATAKQIDVDMVQQGGEPHLRISLGCLSYTVQPAWPDPRLGIRFGLGSSAFSLVNGLPSTISFGLPGLRSTASLVLCRCATPYRRTRGSYSSSPSPTDPHPTGCEWPQGLSVLACPEGPQFPCMPGVYDSAVPATHKRCNARHSVAFRLT